LRREKSEIQQLGRVGEGASSPKIAVIGPCASGKSTLVRSLCAAGYDARVCAQEHSEIPTLWEHGHPDMVIALAINLATLRHRRGDEWLEALYITQLRRLTRAVDAAFVVLNTTELDSGETLARAIDAIHQFRPDFVAVASEN